MLKRLAALRLEKCIAAARQGGDHFLAIELDKNAHQFIDRLVQDVGEGIQVNLALAADDIDDGLLLLG